MRKHLTIIYIMIFVNIFYTFVLISCLNSLVELQRKNTINIRKIEKIKNVEDGKFATAKLF